MEKWVLREGPLEWRVSRGSSESSRCPWKEKHHNYLIEHCSKFKQICVPIVPDFKQTSITAISNHESKFSHKIRVHMSFVEGSSDIFAESLQLRRGKGRGCATCPAWDKILRWIIMNHGETKNILCRKSRRGLQEASQQTKWNLKQEKGSEMIRTHCWKLKIGTPQKLRSMVRLFSGFSCILGPQTSARSRFVSNWYT